MAIEIVDLPIKNGDVPELCKRLPGRVGCKTDTNDKNLGIHWKDDAAVCYLTWSK